jgi:hypothetical protein
MHLYLLTIDLALILIVIVALLLIVIGQRKLAVARVGERCDRRCAK